MLAPRWRKVVADFRAHWSRTLIVVLSIAVGVFGVGMIAEAYAILSRGLAEGYNRVNPASARLYTSAFGEDLVRQVAREKDVRQAQGRRRVAGRVRVPGRTWSNLVMLAYKDYGEIEISRLAPEQGAWPPPDRELVLERSTVEFLGTGIGDHLEVETPDGDIFKMRVAGTAHNVVDVPSRLGGIAYGFVTFETLKWLGEPQSYNQLDITVERRPMDEQYVRDVAAEVRERDVEASDRQVFATYVPKPGKHPIDSAIQTALFLFFALGLLSLLLSSFLVVNTIESLMAGQLRQIGIMKAVGARAGQITGIYLATVFVYSVLGLAVGIPSASLAAGAVTRWIAGLFNFDILSYAVPPYVLGLEVAVGLVIPSAAALWPIMFGTRVPVRQAMSGFGLGPDKFGKAAFDRLLERPSRLPRQLLLSVRNTFRHKGRLALTLATLTLGGAIFIAVMSVRASLMHTIDDIARYWGYDVAVSTSERYQGAALVRAAERQPGVAHAEAWIEADAIRVRPDDTEVENITLVAAPADSGFIRPTILAGRWMRATDTREVVVNKDFAKDERVEVGDEIDLKVQGAESTFRVVGECTGELRGPVIYAHYDGAAKQLRAAGRANYLMVATKDQSPEGQEAVAARLEEELKPLGYRVGRTDTNAAIRSRIEYQFNILVAFLLIMAIILAAVGGLGLMGTMSINVLERTREVAVMRAIGASDRAVVLVFLAEGIVVGLMGWAFGSIASVPMSRLLSDTVGIQFFGSVLSYAFSWRGALLWLGIALALAALASILPSLRAARISVQEALAYE